MVIKAIETQYDGCRFRSRLEARWAVFFNEVGLKWHYEPQGYEVPTAAGRIRYLPDFWLGVGMWVEVKGYLDEKAMNRQYYLACGIAQHGNEQDIAMLGDIPGPRTQRWPIRLHAHGTDLWGTPWDLDSSCPLARPGPKLKIERAPEFAAMLTQGMPCTVPDWAEDGVESARQARFEWGESGAPKHT